ncbi:MAG TPA: hypothetical protein VIH89_08495 [Candidatus Sulfotelmatobacter sp.]
MTFWTVLETIVGQGVVAWAMVFGLSKYLGDRLLEGVKAQHSKELAEFSHQRSVLLAEMQNVFSMGANSHMAMVVFDKHIGFCEEYVQAVSNALYALMQEGMKDKPLDAKEFFRIRQKWVLWLGLEIEARLDQFERGVADAQGVDANGAPVSNEIHVRTLIADLREVLGAEKLTTLRNDLLVRSMKPPQVF